MGTTTNPLLVFVLSKRRDNRTGPALACLRACVRMCAGASVVDVKC